MKSEHWEVEWISRIPVDEHGDSMMDDAEYEVRRFPTHTLALAFAEKVIVGLPFEVAYIDRVQEITLQEYRDDDENDVWRFGGKCWMRVGDREEVAT
jgi:hypothetical protein